MHGHMNVKKYRFMFELNQYENCRKSNRNLCVLETGMWGSATADIIVLDRKKLSDTNLREGFWGKDSRSWLS
jgi:hypothetical protein